MYQCIVAKLEKSSVCSYVWPMSRKRKKEKQAKKLANFNRISLTKRTEINQDL